MAKITKKAKKTATKILNKTAAKAKSSSTSAEMQKLAKQALKKIGEGQKALQKVAKEHPMIASAAAAVGLAILQRFTSGRKKA